MRFTSLRMRGIGPFTDEVFVDLEQVPGPLVAVTGANGAGKSMSLEALFGAVYRKMPTRGSLRDVATSRDSFVEVGVVNGQPWTLRQRIDAQSGKGESEVLDAAGAAVLSAAKLREGDAWVAEHLPSPTVVLSSMFGAQGSQGFLDLDPAERKRVILSLLGHDRLEALSKAAGEKARAAKAQLDTLVARIADEQERGGDVEAVRGELTHLKRALELAENRAKTADAALAKAHEDAVEHERQTAARREAERRVGDLCLRKADLGKKLGELDERRGNNRHLLERADDIRAAATKAEELATAIADLEAKQRDAERVHSDATNAYRMRQREAEHAREAVQRLERELRAVEEKVAQRRDLEKTLEGLADAVETRDAIRADLKAAGEELQALEELRLAGKDRRIAGLRGGLEHAASTPNRAKAIAEATLEVDLEFKEELAEAPTRIEEARAVVSAHEKRLREAEARCAERERIEARLATMPDRGDAKAMRGEVDHHRTQADKADAEAKAARANGEAARTNLDTMGPELSRLRREHRELSQDAARLPRLEAAEARLQELDSQRAALVAERNAVIAELAAAEKAVPSVNVSKPSVEQAKDEAEAARKSFAGLQSGTQAAERELARLEASAAKLAELATERAAVEEELADYRLLEQDLGRNGVQALELSAIGPEFTALTNSLLSECYGPRFSVRIEATQPKKSGSGEREGCFVMVTDTQSNREAEAKTFSGGERVLLAEAVNLALVMMGVSRMGLVHPTLVRDESGAALDPDNSRAYVRMLRRAAEHVQADKVLVVSHVPEVADLCDARLHVANGRIEVQS